MHGEGEDAVRATRRLVHIVRRHHFVLQPLPEVLVSVLDAGTLEYVDVFYGDFIRQRVHLDFQTSGIAFLHGSFCRIRVEQVVHFFVVQLDVLNFDADLAPALSFSSLLFDLRKELADGPWDDAFFFKADFEVARTGRLGTLDIGRIAWDCCPFLMAGSLPVYLRD